ncbi:MAG: exodeoxyribonuclease V subunit gamma [Candidatus Omnitrophota bacterium]|nr:exodeoxyribonuclease V subunit gamma [Candidatus Omnitrophota bacterium]
MSKSTRTLLIGPARSGKTHYLLEDFERSIADAANPLAGDFFFALPSAEHTDRIISLIVQRGIKGFFHRRITTLSRLISDCFGVGEDDVATNVTRYVILRDILDRESWPIFAEVQKSPGFLNLMLSFISELKESLIGVQDFRERMNSVKQLEPDYAAKYEAVAAIYEAYDAVLGERGLRDRQDAFKIYEGKKRKKYFRPPTLRKVWLDGFFDFSPLQLAYLGELCEVTEEITLTLTAETGAAREAVFGPVLETAAVLEEMGFKIKTMPRARDRMPQGALRHIEGQLFASKRMTASVPSAAELEVFEAVGMEGEVEMIARAIEKMRREGDYRFSDFAVLLRQIGDYESVIRSVFSRYGIPVEIHEREKLGFSPLVRSIVRLLKIFREKWSRTDVIEFLKSAYVCRLGEAVKDYEWVARLEHWAMREGIFRGREAWLKEERLRVLADLEDRLRSSKNFRELRAELVGAVRHLFGIFQIRDDYEDFVRREAAGYRRFEALLDELEYSFTSSKKDGEGNEFSLDAFMDRFFRLTELDLYSLHEKDKNRVQVYDVSLARQKEYRVVFLAGLLEKRFPVQLKEDPVLSDWERRLFNGVQADDKGALRERLPRQAMERYLFYVAVTRVNEKLVLSYPRLDLEGKESLPSYYVAEVLSLFDGEVARRKQDLGRPYPELDEAVNLRELEMSVMGGLWTAERDAVNRAPLLLYLTNRFLGMQGSRDRFRRAFHEIQNVLTDPHIAPLDPFRSGKTSATKLEDYAKCAFKYYARHVLRLMDPDEDINVMRRGIILHDVLERCFRDWSKNPAIFTDVKRAEADALARLEEALKAWPLRLEKEYQWDLERDGMREMLTRFLKREFERIQASPLKPAYFEFGFGAVTRGDAGPLAIGTETGEILISGKIDRVDVDIEGKVAGILDYKRTAAFKRAELEGGVALQLPIYSMAVRKFLGLQPAGAELYSIRDHDKKGFYRDDLLEFFPEATARRMVLKPKEFEALLERTSAFIRMYANQMRELNIAVRPRLCDSYCPYPAVCRIEKWRLPMIGEEVRAEDEKALLAGKPVAKK